MLVHRVLDIVNTATFIQHILLSHVRMRNYAERGARLSLSLSDRPFGVNHVFFQKG